ncbi:PiggyBac transposable element-derived protein 4-like [Elysia marginata]|uniref:PiggyBac transposable element-derived protein 4-like n=1 Tax=Elysia marginata TaxID=1093978 RepID=A0AAV4GHB4_9GAST|nr:PiggyBac transposable element-derived protein 4-like [Elysia marginata]
MTDLLAEIQELNQVQNTLSDGSDIEDLDHFSNADDFSEDERRYLNAIGREIESMDHMEALRARGQAQDSGDGEDQDPELDAQPQVPPNCPDLNAPADWITENFVQRGELDCQLVGGKAAQYPVHTQPSQYFGLFWTEEWWQHLVTETNTYADQQGPSANWSPVTMQEMRAFIGLTLGMGILKLPVRSDYWRTTKRIFLTQFGSVMSRDSFQVYTGIEAGQAAEHGLAHRVVKDLVAPYHGSGMRVFMDNFYTGVPLLRELAFLGIGACSMVQSNCKLLPPTLLPKRVQLEKHQYRTAQAGDLTYGIWLDTKPVCVQSNFHDPAQAGTVNRRSEHQEQRQVTKKWWRRVFLYLLMVSVHNSYVVAKDNSPVFARTSWRGFKAYLEPCTFSAYLARGSSRQPNITLSTNGTTKNTKSAESARNKALCV